MDDLKVKPIPAGGGDFSQLGGELITRQATNEDFFIEENPELYECLQDVIDIHVHIGPDATRRRRVDALEAAQQAAKVGMKAIVVKNKQYITTPVAALASRLIPGVSVFGGVVLDREVGGLNPDVVEMAGKLGTKVVWMATETALNDLNKKRTPLMDRTFHRPIEGITALDEDGKLKAELEVILDIIKDYDMVLATGHFSTKEILVLLKRAKEKKMKRIVVNHPLTISFGPDASISEQKEMASLGALIEHTFVPCMPAHDRIDPRKIVEAINEIGAERTIVSSDFGQYHNPPPVEGMRMIIRTLLGYGITQAQLDLMLKENPARLLDL
ncbi:MAG: hypothetical protein DRP87_08430 [Spirochaetes bacterium]|nr:MAG: hypothetical protein DRP87_08430 [Spirochaetota bacterium]